MGTSAVARPLRRRRTVRPRGKISVDAFVECRVRRESIPLGVCAACTRCMAVPVDVSAEDAEVQCAEPPSAPSRRRLDADLVELALRTPASAVAPRDVLVVAPELLATEAAAVLEERGMASAAVVDDDGLPLGVIMRADLARARREDALPVGALLRPFKSTVLEDTPLVHALPALLEPSGETLAPVVNASGDLVTVLSAGDVVRWLALRAGFEV
jgi:CBS domain-containing protein